MPSPAASSGELHFHTLDHDHGLPRAHALADGFAFRELGRVIRTLFLLKYLNEPELRRTIHATTNKSEQFNDFAQWLMFGGDGIIAENLRHEQRKVIKYNQLVANMVILHNVQCLHAHRGLPYAPRWR